MTFVWINRDGRHLELDSPKPIEEEAEAVSREIDALVDLLNDPEQQMRGPARDATRLLNERLSVLRSELDRWNAQAMAAANAVADALHEQIDRLPEILGQTLLVVRLHDDHQQIIDITAGAPNTRADLMAGPMTGLQRQAIAAVGSRNSPPATATREQAQTWLDHQPRFVRQRHADNGWFVWIDRHGHAHRLIDPLPIEREVAAIASELAALRPRLVDRVDPAVLYATVIAGTASWGRLQILKEDLERFEQDDIAREDVEWNRYAADWRSKRSK